MADEPIRANVVLCDEESGEPVVSLSLLVQGQPSADVVFDAAARAVEALKAQGAVQPD